MQIWPHLGDDCGSSYLNESAKDHLLVRLRDETYLEVNGITRQSIVKKLAAVDFERQKKRINIYENPDGGFFITGLRSDKSRGLTGEAAKRFGPNTISLDRYVNFDQSKLGTNGSDKTNPTIQPGLRWHIYSCSGTRCKKPLR